MSDDVNWSDWLPPRKLPKRPDDSVEVGAVYAWCAPGEYRRADVFRVVAGSRTFKCTMDQLATTERYAGSMPRMGEPLGNNLWGLYAVLICRAGETPPPPEEVWRRAYGEPEKATAVPWPEVTVGSKWDRYEDRKFTQSFVVTSVESHLVGWNGNCGLPRSFKPGGAPPFEYIPHGWDYATKQPKPEPTATEPARGNKESIDPSIRLAAEAQRAKREMVFISGNMARDLANERLIAARMQAEGHYAGQCLIDQEQPARVSAFTERFGKPTPSKRYRPSDDVDGDIPDADEVWR